MPLGPGESEGRLDNLLSDMTCEPRHMLSIYFRVSMFNPFTMLMGSWKYVHNIVVWNAAEFVVGARLGAAMPLEDFERYPLVLSLLRCVPIDLTHPLSNKCWSGHNERRLWSIGITRRPSINNVGKRHDGF